MHEETPVELQLNDLAEHLERSQATLLEQWYERVAQDPSLTIASKLSRQQFYDHIPLVFSTLFCKLRSWPEPPTISQQAAFPKHEESHFRHRWRWGYDMRALISEWGHLNTVLVAAVHDYARDNPAMTLAGLSQANHVLAEMMRESVTENISEYAGLLEAEAATRVRDLTAALRQVEESELARGELLRASAHDLRGSLGIVTGSLALIDSEQITPQQREQVKRRARKALDSLNRMLVDLMDLARLEAGQETRALETIDAAKLLSELCASVSSLAAQRGLALETSGPSSLLVSSDPVKLRRIAQNLILNSLKYTTEGKVTVTWGEGEGERWRLSICDTGPGFNPSAAPLAAKLQIEEEPASDPASSAPRPPGRTTAGGPGEGVGLSIVKRLCELLDASFELQSSPGRGTTALLDFPHHYDEPAPTT